MDDLKISEEDFAVKISNIKAPENPNFACPGDNHHDIKWKIINFFQSDAFKS